MTSFAQVTPTNLELTPMQVLFQGPSDLVPSDLGATLSGVTISAKYAKGEIKADQLGGETVIDRRVTGAMVTVTTELAEIKRKALFKILFPHATLITTGTKAFDFKAAIGSGDLENAGILTLHPLSIDASDPQYDWTFFKACASAESEFVYGPSDQVKAKIVWNVLPDLSVTPARYFRYGDTTLV